MRNPRHILITGASSGLGAALALDYAALGVTLFLHGRDRQRLSSVADQVRLRGAHVYIHTGDVRDAKDMADWIGSCDRIAELDLVVANAGLSAGTAQGDESLDQLQTLFAVNVIGLFNTVEPALGLMKERARGQIALLSSLASFRGLPGAPAYCASKAAIRVYGEGLRAHMKQHHVEINVICPGFIKTPMTDINPFPMPFMISAEKAAGRIRHGLRRNHGRIAFPKRLYILSLILSIAPQVLAEAIAARTPRK